MKLFTICIIVVLLIAGVALIIAHLFKRAIEDVEEKIDHNF